MTDRRPLIVVEGQAAAVRRRVDAARDAAATAGWRIVRGWAAPLTGELVVCTGVVRTADEARRALLAAVSGAGLVVGANADGDTVSRFVDDLRRLGRVEHVVLPSVSPALLTPGQRALLGLLAEGLTIDEAATELGVARRTADRRLASARRTLRR